jgi:hypothetical protein
MEPGNIYLVRLPFCKIPWCPASVFTENSGDHSRLTLLIFRSFCSFIIHSFIQEAETDGTRRTGLLLSITVFVYIALGATERPNQYNMITPGTSFRIPAQLLGMFVGKEVDNTIIIREWMLTPIYKKTQQTTNCEASSSICKGVGVIDGFVVICLWSMGLFCIRVYNFDAWFSYIGKTADRESKGNRTKTGQHKKW